MAGNQNQQTLANVDWKSMPRDLALIRMENDLIQTMAAARPRDHKQVLANMTSQLSNYPSFARSAIYSKPVGRKPDFCEKCKCEVYRKNKQIAQFCPRCNHKVIIEGAMQFAKGLSVRAAEALAEAYGFCRVRADVEILTEDRVKITATFSDFATGRVWEDSRIVSRHFRYANGSTGSHSDDRFFNVVIPAEKSKLIREVVNRSVPPGLRSELEDRVEAMLEKLLDDKTIEKIIVSFAGKGVDARMLERFLGAPRDAWTHEHREQLATTWNALKDGEVDVREMFDFHDETDFAPAESAEPKKGDEVPEPQTPQAPASVPAPASTATAGEKKATAAHFMQPKGAATERPPQSKSPAPAAAKQESLPPPDEAGEGLSERDELLIAARDLGLTAANVQLDVLIADALALNAPFEQKLEMLKDVAAGVPGAGPRDYSLPAAADKTRKGTELVDEESQVADEPDESEYSEYVWGIVNSIKSRQRISEVDTLVKRATSDGCDARELQFITQVAEQRKSKIRSWGKSSK